MSAFSPETRALLEQARREETMPAASRAEIRGRLAVALGVSAPVMVSATAAASVGAATWTLRGLAALGAAGMVTAAVLVPLPAITPPTRLGDVQGAPQRVIAAPRSLRGSPPLPVVAPSADSSAPPRAALSAEPLPSTPPATHPHEPAPHLGSYPARADLAAPTRGPTPIPEPAPDAAPTEDLLLGEVRLVGDARGAIERGDALRALAILADHDRRYPNGALRPETAALRVDALCAAGRTNDAEVEASRFRETYPGSPLVRRFASTCVHASSGGSSAKTAATPDGH